MSEKPTIEEHAKIMEDAWHSAEEQNIIFSRTISEQQAELEALKDEVERLRGKLVTELTEIRNVLDAHGSFDKTVATIDAELQALEQADGGKETTNNGGSEDGS
jgi:chromosome segregation ATPase